MNVWASWKESWLEVAALRTKNGRLLGAAIQKKIKETYQILFKHWWFLALVAGSLLAVRNYNEMDMQTVRGALRWPFLACMSYLAMVFLSARASVHKKNYSYFAHHARYILGYFLACTATVIACFAYSFARPWLISTVTPLTYYWVVAEMFIVLFPFNFHVANFVSVPRDIFDIISIVGCCYSAFISFFMFFWVDSAGTVSSFFRSMSNSLKMILYNLPFVVLVCLLFVGIHNLLLLLSGVIPASYLIAFYVIFVVPAMISIFSVFYSKKVHEQFNTYFPVTLVE